MFRYTIAGFLENVPISLRISVQNGAKNLTKISLGDIVKYIIKRFNLPEKYVMIDGFKIPADKGEEYKRLRDSMAKEADKFFHTFCEEVKKQKLVDILGEGIVGYSSTGEMLARISLDPFELSALNVAKQRKKLHEYMLATNGYDDDDYQQLLKEFKERQAERKAAKEKKA